MKRITRTIILIPLLLLLISCGGRKVMRDLLNIESYINEQPDSALSALRQIDTLSLRTKAEKAKYSLLHAMALDKNYIDTADTKIIMPAVEYYGRHGSPEDRLKALMYLGVEQYNAGLYNQAIVSFHQASEYAPQTEDLNLLGVLYSRIADTYTMTRDYYQASEYIDKSIECFHQLNRTDQEFREKYRKAQNLVNVKDWKSAFSLYEELLNNTPSSASLLSSIEANYAMTLLLAPESSAKKALDYFEKALAHSVEFIDENQYGAYAFSLFVEGFTERSDSIMKCLLSLTRHDNLYYNYWSHRIQLCKGDYKNAYNSLWESKRKADSLMSAQFRVSAANAQAVFFELENRNKSLIIKNQRITLCTTIVLGLSIFILFLILYGRRRHLEKAENERKARIILSLQDQIKTSEREKTKAKFFYLSDLYKVIRYSGDDGSDSALERVYLEIEHRVKVLRNDEQARSRFEERLNDESNNIMVRFRSDYPELTENDYWLASCLFAGFDNSTLSLIIGKAPNNIRVMKNRLKSKIQSSTKDSRNDYLSYF